MLAAIDHHGASRGAAESVVELRSREPEPVEQILISVQVDRVGKYRFRLLDALAGRDPAQDVQRDVAWA